jgi:hypothetical protein
MLVSVGAPGLRLVIAKASLRVLGQSLVREFHPKEFTLSV